MMRGNERTTEHRDGQSRHYIGLLLGIPLLLFGIWLAGWRIRDSYSGDTDLHLRLKFLIIPGAALAAAGGYLISRAR